MGFSWARLVAWLVALVVGAVYGAACTITQSFLLGGFPLGLVLVILGAAALLAAIRLLTADRWAVLTTGAGIMIATIAFSGTGPGGSVIVPAAAEGAVSTGIIWTVAVPILTVMALVWPEPAGSRPARAG